MWLWGHRAFTPPQGPGLGCVSSALLEIPCPGADLGGNPRNDKPLG